MQPYMIVVSALDLDTVQKAFCFIQKLKKGIQRRGEDSWFEARYISKPCVSLYIFELDINGEKLDLSVLKSMVYTDSSFNNTMNLSNDERTWQEKLKHDLRIVQRRRRELNQIKKILGVL